jgi:O-acetyl-ADP-ribose deacetylase (regulator of RNase III)
MEATDVIEMRDGSLFDSGADALVCPVNCKGVMGAGLALAFKRRFPWVVEPYVDACRQEHLRPGQCFITYPNVEVKEPAIILFPTKDDWKEPSLEWHIFAGLGNMLSLLNDFTDIRSVAIPALGCGLGGLKPEWVLPLIQIACRSMPDREFYGYWPQ